MFSATQSKCTKTDSTFFKRKYLLWINYQIKAEHVNTMFKSKTPKKQDLDLMIPVYQIFIILLTHLNETSNVQPCGSLPLPLVSGYISFYLESQNYMWRDSLEDTLSSQGQKCDLWDRCDLQLPKSRRSSSIISGITEISCLWDQRWYTCR